MDVAMEGELETVHGCHGSHGNNDTKQYTMMMYFHTALTDYILLKPLLVTEVGEMLAACLGVFVVSVLYELLKFGRERHLLRSVRSHRPKAPPKKEPGAEEATPPTLGLPLLSSAHCVQTGLHAVQITVSYLLMLVFMTYSLWLCAAAVLGSAAGHFVAGWRRSAVVDISEHCH